jgi:iron complex outermembrane receptor protein
MFFQKTAQFFCSAFALASGLCCFAENKSALSDTFELKEVVISSSKSYKETARINFSNLENYSARRLPLLLSEVSGIYLKNYGNGQLTTIAVRGTTSAQTEVLWNGVRINSPMLGQSDFALLNVGFHNSISIQYNQLYSAIGSNILLDNSPPEVFPTFEGLIRGGSFGLMEANLSAHYGTKRLRAASKLAVLKCKNNFPIFKDNTHQKQSNAAVSQWAFFQELHHIINTQNQLEWYVWFNNAYREIPPTLLQDVNRAYQQDQSCRTMLRWKFQRGTLHFSATTAYLLEQLRYTHHQLLIDDKSIAQAWRNNFQIVYGLKKWRIDAQIFADLEAANSAGYNTKHHRGLSGFWAKTAYALPAGIHFSLGMRQEFLNTKNSPFMPFASVAFSKKIYRHSIGADLTGRRSFRFPTFNDLYWRESGNPKLLPEDSWNAELAANYKWNNTVTVSLANFYAWVKNQIQWSPDISGRWRPKNLKSVFTRGCEMSASFSLPKDRIKNFESLIFFNYSFTLSTQTQSLIPHDEALGKQVIYVPRHRVAASMVFGYAGFGFQAVYRYTGLRFISTDNSDWLPAYSLLDFELYKTFFISTSYLRLSFRINNATNHIYQDVAQRPMPPRNFEGSLTINIR